MVSKSPHSNRHTSRNLNAFESSMNKRFRFILLLFAVSPITFFPMLRDPFVIPRLFVLALCFSILSILFLRQTKFEIYMGFEFNKFPKFLVITFFILILISTYNNRGNSSSSILFGDYGRLIGVIPLCTSILLALYLSQVININEIRLVPLALMCVGIIYSIWSIFIFLFDTEIEKNSKYDGIQGLGGNVNFSSSTISISIVISLALIYFKLEKVHLRILAWCCITLGAAALILSSSAIGAITLILGLVFIPIIDGLGRQLGKNRIKANLPLLSLLIIGAIFSRKLGELILAEFKGSVVPRIEMAQMTLQVIRDNIFWGIGPDQIQYVSYLYAKDNNAAGGQNSSHNVFLDIAAMFGVGTALVIFLYSIYGLVCGVKLILKGNQMWDKVMVILLVGLGLQMMLFPIQLTQISLATFVISYFINQYSIKSKEEHKTYSKYKGLSLIHSISLMCISSVILVLSTKLLINDFQMRRAFEGGQILRLEETLENWPKFDGNYETAIALMRWSDLPERELEFARKLIALNGNNRLGWDTILNSTLASNGEKERALTELRKLGLG